MADDLFRQNRDDLISFLGNNQRLIRAFETLFRVVPEVQETLSIIESETLDIGTPPQLTSLIQQFSRLDVEVATQPSENGQRVRDVERRLGELEAFLFGPDPRTEMKQLSDQVDFIEQLSDSRPNDNLDKIHKRLELLEAASVGGEGQNLSSLSSRVTFLEQFLGI